MEEPWWVKQRPLSLQETFPPYSDNHYHSLHIDSNSHAVYTQAVRLLWLPELRMGREATGRFIHQSEYRSFTHFDDQLDHSFLDRLIGSS